MNPIILASQSPRRKELMAMLPVTFEVRAKEIEEKMDEQLTAKENVQSLATQKAEIIAKENPMSTVIGCDTIVVFEGEIFGKPRDEADAKKMLSKLSGKTHFVYTGVSILNKEKHIEECFAVSSKVTMKVLSEEEIMWYIQTKEPLDKAGSYGIQGQAALFIEKIEGDYFNIVGLPIHALYERLSALGMIALA